MKALDIMKNNPYSIFPQMSVVEANTIMKELGVGCFPVVKEDNQTQIVGIVNETDLLAYSPPDDYPQNLKHHKFFAASKKKVADIMYAADKLVFVYEEEDANDFLKKFFRQNSPPFNFKLVVNTEKEKKLRGTINWINILRKWNLVASPEFLDLQIKEIATPLSHIPSLSDTNFHIGSALARSKNTIHRHIPIIRDGKVVKLFHFHELSGYQPIDDDIEQADYYFNLSLQDIRPKHTVAERLISGNTYVKDAIGKFLMSVGEADKWQNRLTGLLLEGDGTITHLLTPFDIISQQIKKKLK